MAKVQRYVDRENDDFGELLEARTILARTLNLGFSDDVKLEIDLAVDYVDSAIGTFCKENREAS
jgi:hypothetical protein